jgi:hypothetical protein
MVQEVANTLIHDASSAVVHTGLLATNLSLLPSRCQPSVSFAVHLLLTTGQHIPRCDIADGSVQADVVVMLDVVLLFSDLCQRSIFPKARTSFVRWARTLRADYCRRDFRAGVGKRHGRSNRD